MELIIEFYNDNFDVSVLNGFGYAYTQRLLHMYGSREHLLEAVAIVNSITVDCAITLRRGRDEQEKEMEKAGDGASHATADS